MKRWIIGSLAFLVIIAIGTATILARRGKVRSTVTSETNGTSQSPDGNSSTTEAGRQLSGGKCDGSGPRQLTHSAMDPDDFAFIIPYGLMVGGHVTPIDHMYYSPAERDSPRDAYPVYAMGDARLVEIQHRTQQPQDNAGTRSRITDEWRLVFSQSCTFLYYYDLLTSLTPELEALVGDEQYVHVDVPVKGGERIGAIGGQTLDFAVWNTEKPLGGFVVPEHYQAERWKIFTDDPLLYYPDELKQFMLSRYPRVDEPLSGKIDWDADGTLRGNWFLEGTDGAGGDRNNPKGSWVGHLSFAPDLYDPSRWMVSMGDYPVAQDANTQVSATQFYARASSPSPESVTLASGPTKIELVHEDYVAPDGKRWDQWSFVKGPKVGITGQSNVLGTALVELTADRTLRFEVFPGKAAAQVTGFSAAAKHYTR